MCMHGEDYIICRGLKWKDRCDIFSCDYNRTDTRLARTSSFSKIKTYNLRRMLKSYHTLHNNYIIHSNTVAHTQVRPSQWGKEKRRDSSGGFRGGGGVRGFRQNPHFCL